jgi:competence protein ComEA
MQVVGLLLVLCIAGGVFVMAPRLLTRASPLVVLQPPITVSVSGEVLVPGVYSLAFGARVAELIEAAGGALPTAAVSLLTLADPLTAGESVHVPALAAADGRAARVSINSDPPTTLDSLPGIGPVMAARIVEHRPYGSVDDLLRVPGIGPRTLERLKPLVTL